MTSVGLLDAGALVVAALAVVVAAGVLLRARDPRLAATVLLDLLTAAALVQLAVEPDLRRTSAVAGLLLVRQLAVLRLQAGPGGRVRAGARRGPAGRSGPGRP